MSLANSLRTVSKQVLKNYKPYSALAISNTSYNYQASPSLNVSSYNFSKNYSQNNLSVSLSEQNNYNNNNNNNNNNNYSYTAQNVIAGLTAASIISACAYQNIVAEEADWDQIRKEIVDLLDSDESSEYEDGSYGPVLVRLAWHASGTYDVKTKTGGSNGATMRFKPESGHGANAGLGIARNLLEPIKQRHPEISYADLWTLAGCVAIEELGGPHINWRSGRTDEDSGKACPPDGRLPDAAQGQDHVRDIFYRMGFNDREIVALVGCHVLGRCHTSRSGYDGPWTNSPITFSNDYFCQLLEVNWTERTWAGPQQYKDPQDQIMMTPADMALIRDPEFKKIVEEYAKDEKKFFEDFAKAFKKLMELGVNFKKQPHGLLKSLGFN